MGWNSEKSMCCRYTALMHKVIYRRQGKAGKGDWSHTRYADKRNEKGEALLFPQPAGWQTVFDA